MTEREAAAPPPPELDGMDLGLPATRGMDFEVRVPETPVFSRERIGELLAGIERLRPHWKERDPGYRHLGIAHYIEGRVGALAPHEIASSNALLDGAFGPAFDDLVTFLARELDAPVELGHGLPRPGFHIIDGPALRPGQPVGDSHFDLQYVAGRFDGTVRESLSVTVPLELPAAGASLEHWPIDFAELQHRIAGGELEDLADAERRLPMETVRYAPGMACLQRGLPLHRMGALERVEPGDRRVTMQCHAALVGARWVVYW